MKDVAFRFIYLNNLLSKAYGRTVMGLDGACNKQVLMHHVLVADNTDGSGDRIAEPGAHAAAEVSSKCSLVQCCHSQPVLQWCACDFVDPTGATP